jgi:hypothetical protein
MARSASARTGVALGPREQLLFEAGIKLGGIFHQFVGTPVAPSTAPGLARAIAAAVRLQPYVIAARVAIRPERGGRTGRGRFSYRYLTAEMLEATVTLADGATEVVAHVDYVARLRYPLMRVLRVRRRRARFAQPRRSARAT